MRWLSYFRRQKLKDQVDIYFQWFCLQNAVFFGVVLVFIWDFVYRLQTFVLNVIPVALVGTVRVWLGGRFLYMRILFSVKIIMGVCMV